MLEIKRILKSTDFGGTNPVWIIANDNNEYLLKFRYDENELDVSNFFEYLSYRLIQELRLNINIPEFNIINITEKDLILFENAFENKLITLESYEFAKKSVGPNFGVKKILNVQKAPDNINHPEIKNIIHIDNYVLNQDRTPSNPNILISLDDKNKIYTIDFGLALLEHRIYENIYNLQDINDPLFSAAYHCNIQKYEFYLFKKYQIEKDKIIKTNKTFDEIKDIISYIIDEMPDEWEPKENKEKIINLIAYRILNIKIWESQKCPMEIQNF